MTRVRAIIVEGPASAAEIAAIRAELADQEDMIVIEAPVSVAEIAKRVSFEMGVPLREIMSDRRCQRTARARKAICWLARRVTQRSLPQIGRALNRDHSAVIHASRTAELLRGRDPAFKRLTDRLAAEFEEQGR